MTCEQLKELSNPPAFFFFFFFWFLTGLEIGFLWDGQKFILCVKDSVSSILLITWSDVHQSSV